MNESLLQYAWQYKLFEMVNLVTVDGTPVEVIDVGQMNRDAGPDFFNAKIRLGGTLWAGNVEIHLLASDWYRHHHDSDSRYDSVILHVVEKSDLRIPRRDGELIPQLEIHLVESVQSGFHQLQNSTEWIRCGSFCQSLDRVFLNYHISRMVCHRLYRKSDELHALLLQTRNNWSVVFYQLLMRSLGMHVNSLPFELLAKATPLNCIARIKGNLFQIEALLLGQAGLLEDADGDDYYLSLRKEYLYQSHKFGLSSISPSLWKYARMRPANFPHVRIAQVAALMNRSEHLFSKIIESDSVERMKDLFSCHVSDYWKSHFRFGHESKSIGKHWDNQTINSLIINTCIPLLFAYGNIMERENLTERATSFLEQLPPEHNNVTEGWKRLHIEAANGYQSQGLIELKREFCEHNKCLQCPIGHRVLCKKKHIPN